MGQESGTSNSSSSAAYQEQQGRQSPEIGAAVGPDGGCSSDGGSDTALYQQQLKQEDDADYQTLDIPGLAYWIQAALASCDYPSENTATAPRGDDSTLHRCVYYCYRIFSVCKINLGQCSMWYGYSLIFFVSLASCFRASKNALYCIVLVM
jgi:hypothetical protein